jgi:ribosomal protein S18 acetylase RimI-like enzyme
VIRSATPDDLPLVRELFREFCDEIPDERWRDDDGEDDLRSLEAAVGEGRVLLDDDVGIAALRKTGQRVAELELLHVRAAARRSGVAGALVQEAASRLRDQGVEVLELSVLTRNEDARSAYERLGFTPVELRLAARVESLLDLGGGGPTFGSVHVQTDDTGAVERAAQKALPRLGRSAGTAVSGPRNGWVAVHDELCDREPKLLQRLGRELSYALAAVVLAIGVEEGALVRYTLYDRGGAVDEYASVPEYYGELPPGDVVALGANPTVVSRLTGAEPSRVREVGRTARAPGELPPAAELVEAIAETMGVAEAGHGWVPS